MEKHFHRYLANFLHNSDPNIKDNVGFDPNAEPDSDLVSPIGIEAIY